MTNSQGTNQPGSVNRNAQRVIRDTGLPGTEQGQTAFALECEQCQHRYATNGSDIFERRCPKCQSGKSGIPIDAGELRRN
jgi:Zn finger protein HypA/HybF involved in hydrogenase expression